MRAAVPVYGRYDWFSAQGEGRPQFIAFLQKFVVKKPYLGNRREYLEASPITKVRPDAPPFFVLHGEDDSIIPVPEGREFVEELRKVSTSPVAYSEIPHAQHAFDFFGSPRGHYTAEAIERFLSWVHAQGIEPYCAIAVSTTVRSSERPAAERISTNASIMASLSSCGSSRVAPSESTEMLSWST